MIKLLIGGSPCTHWSIAQKNNRETEPEGLGWELFKNYLIAKEKFKPDFFLYENNKSAAQPIKDQISRELGVDLMYINSALVSAQNRQRFYAFNWEVEQPEDREIMFYKIIDGINRKWLPLQPWTQGYWQTTKRIDQLKTFDSDKSYCVTTSKTHNKNYYLSSDKTKMSKLTADEVEILQTLPKGYTSCISETQRFKAIGNGWTAEVIIHILNGVLKDVPRDEELVVLSMYDGIGTGRYCLDKMGFTNVKYYAYEIDKYAKQVAMSNYPDIIQCGDAFDLRHPDWTIGY